MARTLSITKAGNNVAFSNGGFKLSKEIAISNIEKHEFFERQFPINPDTKLLIQKSMEKSGFDSSQPLHIWLVEEEDETKHYYLIDGYTRLQAATDAGLKVVPYYEHKFKDQNEAFEYIIHLQFARRIFRNKNDLYKFIIDLLDSDLVKNYDGYKNQYVADMLGISVRTIERVHSLYNNADDQTLEDLYNNEITPTEAERKVKKSKTKSEKNDSDVDEGDTELSDSLEDNSDDPKATFVHQRKEDDSPHLAPPVNKDIDEWTVEKNIQVNAAREEGIKEGMRTGFSDAFQKGFLHCCYLMKSGKSLSEIFNDDSVSDFSAITEFEYSDEEEKIIDDFYLGKF